MRAIILFRIASVVFLLFALGHTVGFLSFKPPTVEGLAVRKAMGDVVFKVGGSDLSYGGVFDGPRFALFSDPEGHVIWSSAAKYRPLELPSESIAFQEGSIQ